MAISAFYKVISFYFLKNKGSILFSLYNFFLFLIVIFFLDDLFVLCVNLIIQLKLKSQFNLEYLILRWFPSSNQNLIQYKYYFGCVNRVKIFTLDRLLVKRDLLLKWLLLIVFNCKILLFVININEKFIWVSLVFYHQL